MRIIKVYYSSTLLVSMNNTTPNHMPNACMYLRDLGIEGANADCLKFRGAKRKTTVINLFIE